jgi:hypothetical protein
MYHFGSHWTDFREIWYWGFLGKICRETPNLFKIAQKYLALQDVRTFILLTGLRNNL